MKAKNFNRLWRMKIIVAIKLQFKEYFDLPAVNVGEIFSAQRAELCFATFFWKVAKIRNPNNPVNPV